MQHSKTALGYLAREAPLLTWLPLLACAAAVAAGVWACERRLVWAALGALASYALTIWQVTRLPCIPSLPQCLPTLILK
jgi:hypothetical protein